MGCEPTLCSDSTSIESEDQHPPYTSHNLGAGELPLTLSITNNNLPATHRFNTTILIKIVVTIPDGSKHKIL